VKAGDVSAFQHFSAPADYELLAAKFERLNRLYFVRNGIYPTPEYPVFEGLLSLPDLGVVHHPAYWGAPRYFVFPAPPKLRVKQRPPREGAGAEFELAGSSFRVCVLFTPNGIWQRFVVCSTVEVTNPIGGSVGLYKELRSCFAGEYAGGQKYFTIPTFAGPAALALLGEGYRLCANPTFQPDHDFQLNSSQE
jgi:hypothetical protein